MALSQILIKLPPDLKSRVKLIAQKEGKNFSLLVRELLEKYVKERDMEGYIDNLWGKISKELEPVEVDKIDKLIHTIRQENR